MNAVQPAQSYPVLGTHVTLVGTWGKQTLPLNGTVVGENPFVIELTGLEAKAIYAPSAVKVLWQSAEGCMLGEGTASHVETLEDKVHVEVRRVSWENLERRRHARYAIHMGVALRAVTECEGQATIGLFNGETSDISMGGCWVTMHDEVLPEGSLVEFHSSSGLRALSIVVRSSQERLGIGLAFIEFSGNTRDLLFDLLNRAA